MCTNITSSEEIHGVGKGPDGWFEVTKAIVGYDHTTHSKEEHALLLDFMNFEIGPSARVALELDLDSGRQLVSQLQAAIAAAELSGV